MTTTALSCLMPDQSSRYAVFHLGVEETVLTELSMISATAVRRLCLVLQFRSIEVNEADPTKAVEASSCFSNNTRKSWINVLILTPFHTFSAAAGTAQRW